MITVYQDIISDEEIKEFLDYYQKHIEEEFLRVDKVYVFKSINIIDHINEFKFLRRLRYTNYDRIRIQHVDNKLDMLLEPHRHTPPYSFIVFLNDDYEGGELFMDNITFKPKKGQLIYFTGDEPHYVNNVTKGDRYTLVGFTVDKNLNLNYLNII